MYKIVKLLRLCSYWNLAATYMLASIRIRTVIGQEWRYLHDVHTAQSVNVTNCILLMETHGSRPLTFIICDGNSGYIWLHHPDSR